MKRLMMKLKQRMRTKSQPTKAQWTKSLPQIQSTGNTHQKTVSKDNNSDSDTSVKKCVPAKQKRAISDEEDDAFGDEDEDEDEDSDKKLSRQSRGQSRKELEKFQPAFLGK